MPVPDTVYLSTPTDTSTSALGGAGALDLKLPADQASTPPAAGLGLPAPNSPL